MGKRKNHNDLWIGDRYYNVPLSREKLELLITRVLKARQDEHGNIACFNKRYVVSAEAAEILDGFVMYLYEGKHVISPKVSPDF